MSSSVVKYYIKCRSLINVKHVSQFILLEKDKNQQQQNFNTCKSSPGKHHLDVFSYWQNGINSCIWKCLSLALVPPKLRCLISLSCRIRYQKSEPAIFSTKSTFIRNFKQNPCKADIIQMLNTIISPSDLPAPLKCSFAFPL